MWHGTAETLDIYAQDVEFHHHFVPGNRGSGDVGVAAGRTPRPESMATFVLADTTSEALASLCASSEAQLQGTAKEIGRPA